MVRAKTRRPLLMLAGLALSLTLAACGLGRNSEGDNGGIDNPTVAATVNGRPIYVEDVRTRAVTMGRLQEGEDLSADSDAFYLTLEELIQIRLFAMEAEARGLDREPDIRRRLENAREEVLARAIYEEIDTVATDPARIERLYRENMRQLDQGEEIHLRHIQMETREMADAAKRRLDSGERFEVLALSLSMDAATRADGGDLGFAAPSDLAPAIRTAVQGAAVNSVIGPIQVGDTWHLFRVDDIRERGSPSMASLTPQIINWLRYQEVMQLQDRLERDARIERLREPDTSMAPTEDTPAPADATPEEEAPPPATEAPHTGAPAPPFPFPMGPGGVTAQQQAPRPTPNTEGPNATAVGAPQQSAPAPAQGPATPAPDQPVQ
jgi:peptidyl-prolyl cis-trans isomerase C